MTVKGKASLRVHSMPLLVVISKQNRSVREYKRTVMAQVYRCNTRRPEQWRSQSDRGPSVPSCGISQCRVMSHRSSERSH